MIVSSELELLLTWSADARAEGGRLTHARLGHSVVIPPVLIREDSSSADVELAEIALASGMVSSRHEGRITLLSLLRAELQLPLKPVSVITLPPSALKTAAVIGAASARAHLVPLLILTVLTGILLAVGAYQGVHIVLAVWLVVATVAVHEVGHGFVLRMLSRATPAVFVMHRLGPRIVRPEIRPKADILVTIAGPLSPVLLQLALTPPLLQAPLELVVASVLSLSHLLTLVLRSGDGQELRLAITRSRQGGDQALNQG